ncbi:hypothetical protein PENTCL1PPCAC_29668, partial [Pristionchus entomophagus]
SMDERKNLIGGFGVDRDIPCTQIDSSSDSETCASSSDLSPIKENIIPKEARGERFYRRRCFIEYDDDDEEPEIMKGQNLKKK